MAEQSIMGAFKEGYESSTAVREDVAAKQTLSEAYNASATDQAAESGVANQPVDMFKVNTLAAQMAASKGETRIADKFYNQASGYKKDELANLLQQNKVDQDRLEAFEQRVTALDTPEAAEQLILSDKTVPPEQKLRMVDQLRSQGLDKFKDMLQRSTMTAKDRLTAADRTLKLKQDHELNLEKQKDKRDHDRIWAGIQSSLVDIKERELALKEDKFEFDKTFKGAKTLIDIDKTLQKEISKVDRDITAKPKDKARRIAELEEAAQRSRDILNGNSKGEKPVEAPAMTEKHVNELVKFRNNPEAIKSFDKRFGNGAAKEILSRYDQENKPK